MSSFTTPIRVEALKDGRRWKLLEDFVYDIGHKGSPDSIVVKTGFITDMGSIPRMFWGLIDPWGSPAKAFLTHDWNYHTHRFSRRKSDKILLESMKVLGVPWFKRHLIYSSVRLFGKSAWKKNKK